MARPPKQPDDQPPPRRNRSEPVGRDAGHAAATAFVRAGFADPTLVLRWREIVGPEVARIARPLRLKDGPSGGVLTLKAEPAAAVFLQHETPTLCARINTYLGRDAVQRLRFVPGKLPGAPKPAAPLPPAPPDTGAEDPLQNFKGPESLKSALLELARTRRKSGSGKAD